MRLWKPFERKANELEEDIIKKEISNRRDAKYGRSQKDLGDGWLLITHSNNPMKKAFIEKISEVLDLGIKVTLKE